MEPCSTGSLRFARGYSQNPRSGTDLSAEGTKPPSRQERLVDKSADFRITPSRRSATARKRVPAFGSNRIPYSPPPRPALDSAQPPALRLTLSRTRGAMGGRPA